MISIPRVQFAILFVFFCALSVNGQSGNNWTFGYGYGLNFNTFPPSTFKSNSANNTMTASMSDSSGQLLFYYDGKNVYNSRHEPIANSNGLYHLDVNSHTEGGAFCFQSQTSENYYIIYLGKSSPGSTVDLYFLELGVSNGTFAILRKNKLLSSDLPEKTDCFSVIKVGDKNTYKMYLRSKDYLNYSDFLTLYSIQEIGDSLLFKLDLTVNKTGIINYGKGYETILSVSRTGRFIANINMVYHPGLEKRQSTYYYLMEMTSSGIDSTILIDSVNQLPTSYEFCIFSPDERFLYYSLRKHSTVDSHISVIYQYELATGLKVKIHEITSVSERYEIAKLGPDGRIYIGRIGANVSHNALSCIKYPNRSGTACGFHRNLIQLWYTSWPYQFPFTINDNGFVDFDVIGNECNDSVKFINKSDSTFKAFTWYFPNDSIVVYSRESVYFNFPKSGTYQIRLKGITKTGAVQWWSSEVSIIKPVTAFFSTNSKPGCQFMEYHFHDESKYDTIKPGSTIRRFWKTGDGTDTLLSGSYGSLVHAYQMSGKYLVQLVLSNGFCVDTFILSNEVVILPSPRAGIVAAPLVGCAPMQVSFQDNFLDPIDSLRISSSSAFDTLVNSHLRDFRYMFITPGHYTVVRTLYGPTGCRTTDSLDIIALNGFGNSPQPELHYASVEDENTISVHWARFSYTTLYELQWQEEINGQWKSIYQGHDTMMIHHHVVSESNTYRLKVYDTCGKYLLSNQVSPIFLQGNAISNDYSELVWSKFNGRYARSIEYKLLRYNSLDTFVATLTTANHYTDLDFFDPNRVENCYQVIAFSTLYPGWTARSNSVCLHYWPQIWIPNSFSPNNDGNNDVFIPHFVGALENDYHISIYNRWGQIVFNSDNPMYGWDGTFGQKDCPEGIYFFILEYQAKNPSQTEPKKALKGTITLIR